MPSSINALLARFDGKEAEADRVAAALEALPGEKWQKRAEAIRGCSSSVVLEVCPSCQSAAVHSVRLCRDRLCPVCQWRLARRRSALLASAMDTAAPGTFPAMLGLTVRNVEGAALRDTVAHISKAATRLMNRKRVRDAIAGHARSLEITRNEQDGTWHPHIHAILLYRKRAYIHHEEWLKLWQVCAGLDYPPDVDIRAIRRTASAWSKAALEVCKYITAPDTMTDLLPADLATLGESMRGVRMLTAGGTLRTAIADAKAAYAPSCQCPECKGFRELVQFTRTESGWEN